MVDKLLFYFVSIAILVGVVFSYSLSCYATILLKTDNQFHFFLRELGSAFVGIVLMWLISRADPDKIINRIGFTLFFLFLFLIIILPFLPESMATEAGGAKRWIRLPGFSLTPVEFFKIGFVFFLAWSFSRKFPKIIDERLPLKDEFILLTPYVVLFLFIVFLISFIQNDLGQVVLLGITLAFLLFFAGGSSKLFAVLMSSSLVLMFVAILTSEHRIHRIKQWWAISQNFILSLLPNSIADILRIHDLPEPYQIAHSLNAIKHGGIFGEGLGNGIIKLGFLSEVHTDIVLAGISEEIGLFGVTIITFLIALIIYRILKIAGRSHNRVYYLFTVGVAILIAFSFLINALGISGMVPIKGIAVPFLSYGGSSVIALCFAVGMVLSISKKADLR